MITLYILMVVFGGCILIQKFVMKKINVTKAGLIAMSALLVFTGIGHFVYTPGMVMMLPPLIPFKYLVIIATGAFEILAGITLLIPRLQKLTSVCLIIFFVLIFPANIYAALHKVNLQTATLDGQGPGFLWLRIPLQIIFIGWTWYFGYLSEKK